MRVLCVSVTAGDDSTGRIANQICEGIIKEGGQALLVYGRGRPADAVPCYKMATLPEVLFHVAYTRLTDRHGLASAHATRRLIRKIEEFKPDVVHLHNIHGYYVNYPILFNYLAEQHIPAVWTLHDCWAFTGHCAYFRDCEGWRNGCTMNCPRKNSYPSSLRSASGTNYASKLAHFSQQGLHLTGIGVSDWITRIAGETTLKGIPLTTIHNGVDTEIFHPGAVKVPEHPILLGVARKWEERKGLDDFVRLADCLPGHWRIRLVGIPAKLQKKLPERIEAVPYVDSVTDMATEYASATVFANLTYADAFPLTNLEALACGTPVVTYRSGGAADAITGECGRVVEPGCDMTTLTKAIIEAAALDRRKCRSHAVSNYSLEKMQKNYYDLLNEVHSNC